MKIKTKLISTILYALSYLIWMRICFTVCLSEFETLIELLLVILVISNFPFLIFFIVRHKKTNNRKYELFRYILTIASSISIIMYVHIYSLYKDDIYVKNTIKHSKQIEIKSNKSYKALNDIFFTIDNISGNGTIIIGSSNNINYTIINVKNSNISHIEGNYDESAFLIRQSYRKKTHKAYYILNEGLIMQVTGDLRFKVNQLNNTNLSLLIDV